MDRAKEIVAKVKQIQPLSHSAMRLLKVSSDEEHRLEDIVTIVETDTALTAQVLKVVNSAAYGLRNPIDTVRRAVFFLNEKTVVGIALSSCAPDVFNTSLDGYESLKGELWSHSLKTAIAARECALLIKDRVNPELAFTAGILHDIGKSVISEFATGLAPEILKKILESPATDYLQAEHEMVGANHCNVGAALAEYWNLPQPLIAVIRFHHRPSKATEKYKALVYMVHLGDMLAMMGGTATGADALQYQLDHRYDEYLNIDRDQLNRIILRVQMDYEKIQESLFGAQSA